MKKSLAGKICFVGCGFILIFILLNMIITYFFMAPFSTLFSRRQMIEIGEEITELHMENDALIEYIDQLDTNNNIKVTLVDGEKNVIYSTRKNLDLDRQWWQESMDLFKSEREKIEQQESVFLTRKRHRRNNKRPIQVIMIRKISEDRYLVMSRTYQSLQNSMYTAIIFELIVGVFLMLLGWLAVYRFSRYLVLPICEMRGIAEHIANMEFDMKVDVKTEDELGELGTSINKMSLRLEENLEQLQEDIEKRKRLVRNLSHEIKSPIAVIMGYADRMKSVISKNPQKALDYCEIISNETVRVDSLVKEMLELSKMEYGGENLEQKDVKVINFLQGIEKRFHETIFDRNIDIYIECRSEDTVYADPVLLERAIYNLVNNAVSHGTGERILVTGSRVGEYYEWNVFNTGSHIDECELDTIWEPFNKIDKARTRGKHGYGVGLSIVREIVEMHNGYVFVKNKDDGIEFTIGIKG